MRRSVSIDVRMLRNSGIGRYIRSIVPHLPSLLDADISLIKNKSLTLANGIQKKAFKFHDVKSSYYSFSEQLEIPFILRDNNRLLWVPHYNFPVLRNGNLVVTVHDLAHIALKAMLGSLLKDIYSQSMFKMLKKKAAKVICVSHFTKHELIKYTGIEEKKIQVIYNGLDSSWYGVRKQKNPETKPFILYVGNVKPHKNLKTLVQAFLNIHEKIPHNLVLVGEKEGFITRDKQIDNLVSRAPDRIRFTGFISDEKLKQYYAHAELMVFPSLYEGFGYPPLEAMACGSPVIASNAASIPEICEDAAEYFEPMDTNELTYKIEKVLFDNELKKELVQRGKKQARKFTIENCAAQTAKVLNAFI